MSFVLHLDFLQQAVKGSWLKKTQQNIKSVSINSRHKMQQAVFFAIKGSQFDGHDFLQQALNQGASCFVVSDKSKAKIILNHKNISILYVENTQTALQDLAKAWTQKQNTKVMLITGSNGKTTCKVFAQTLLASLSPFASPKSYNNGIGLPLSLLQVDRKNSILIQEIGTNQPGDLASLTSLCNAVFSTVIMVGPSHLQGLHSLDLICQEKQQIYLKNPQATWLFNRDNTYTESMFQKISHKTRSDLTCSSHKKSSNIYLRFTKTSQHAACIEGHIDSVYSKAKLCFSGQHNLENLMCACGLALAAGMSGQDIWNAIPKCKLPQWRQTWFYQKEKNISILFDAYNSNPSSMQVFLEACEQVPCEKRKIFILGDMKELGKESEMYHRQLGRQPSLLKAHCIFFIGDYGSLVKQELQKQGFKNPIILSKKYNNTLFKNIQQHLQKQDFLAIKGSRYFKLEQLLQDLKVL